MSYLDIISLSEAKTYLRIDDTNTIDDLQIESMIKSALRYTERYTNHILFPRDKQYIISDYCAKIYDYPINSINSPLDIKSELNFTWTDYETNNSKDKILDLNVGYSSSDDIPSEIKDFALNLVKWYYYEAETDQVNKGEIPMWLKSSVDHYKRFIL